MTEDLESYNDEDYSNENGMEEEEVDKLNDITFGDEGVWTCENFNIESDDSNFERFPFDEYECNGNRDDRNTKDSDDLLGLKGSFFNFGLFKSGKDKSVANNNKDDDFEFALSKLEFLDLHDSVENVIKVNDNHLTFVELTEYADMLLQQFLGEQKLGHSSRILNGTVSLHLNLLKEKLIELSMPMEALSQLRYFHLLTIFVNVDNQINSIRTRCAYNQRAYHTEMAALVQQFALQTQQQQEDMAAIHPFFGGILELARLQRYPVQEQRPEGGICHSPVVDEGGWMSQSEREWIVKLQTRNLIVDNPYLHDYYFTVMKYKEMFAARMEQLRTSGVSTIPDPISLLPSPITADQLGAGVDPTKDGLTPQYHPVQFENSLGVVTASNLNTPRQTIELPPREKIERVTKMMTDSYETVRSRRGLLAIIEKMYCTLLRVDEVDKSLAKMLVEQHHNRSVLLQYRASLLQVLVDHTSEARLVQMFSISKGASLVTSVTSMVSSGQFVHLLRTIFFNCHSIWQSDCFCEVEAKLQFVMVSRIRALGKEELSLLIQAFFSHIVSQSSDHKVRVQHLSEFCKIEFGLNVVLTVLDAFLSMSPDDRSNIMHLVTETLRSLETRGDMFMILREFPVLSSRFVDGD